MMVEDLSGNNPKSIFDSKTFWGAVFTALVSIIPAVTNQIQVPEPCIDMPGKLPCKDQRWNQGIEDWSQILLAIAGAGVTIYGRVSATQRVYTPDGLPGPNKE